MHASHGFTWWNLYEGRFLDRILAICEGEYTPAPIVVEHRCDRPDSGGFVDAPIFNRTASMKVKVLLKVRLG